MGRVQQLLDDVKDEGEFDLPPAEVLRALTRRHRKMVVRARLYRKTVDIGPTVSGQSDYVLPADLLELLTVNLDGTNANLMGSTVSLEVDQSANRVLRFCPTPTTPGTSVLVYGVFRPSRDLDAGDDTTLLTPDDFDSALAAGGIAELMRRGPGDFRVDIAQSFEQEFSDGTTELKRQVARQFRGGPRRIQIAGVDF